MTAPLLIWYVVSRTFLLLSKWVAVAFAAGLVAAMVGSWSVLVVIGFAGYRVWSRRPIPELVVIDSSDDRYRAHLDRVLASLAPDGEPTTPRSGEAAPVVAIESGRSGRPVYIRNVQP